MKASDFSSAALPVSVVAPTFREAGNLVAFANRVETALRGGSDWELLIVDDDSQDGTEEIVREISSSLPVRLHVRKQPPRDLSRSVLLGIRLARFDRVVVMDADLSHPPERIPDLLAGLDAGAEFTLGSRYVEVGLIDSDWSRIRAWGSRLATALARPLVVCSDPLSGFFAMDRRLLPHGDTLQPKGYKIGLEIMVRGRLVVREVPIDFQDRRVGASKMSLGTVIAYLHQLLRLYGYRLAPNLLGRGPLRAKRGR